MKTQKKKPNIDTCATLVSGPAIDTLMIVVHVHKDFREHLNKSITRDCNIRRREVLLRLSPRLLALLLTGGGAIWYAHPIQYLQIF